MARYIDADKFIEWLDVGHLRPPSEICLSELNVKKMIELQPTEDVVPVVRCSQCRKRYTTECALWFSQLDDNQYFCGAIHNDDFYCSYGERK